MAKAALRGAENFRFYADRAPGAGDGRSMPDADHINYSLRQPIGPVGVITPWNTPFMLSTWKIAPALGRGLHGRAQAGRMEPAQRRHPHRDHGCGNPPCRRPGGRRQSRARPRRDRRQEPDRASRHQGHRLRRRDDDGLAIMRQGAATLEARAFRARRQEPRHRVRRRRPGPRARRRLVHDLLAERRALHFVLARAGAALDLRRLRGEGGGAGRHDQGRPSARSRDRDRPADPSAPRRKGAELSRSGARAKARRSRSAASARWAAPAITSQPTLYTDAANAMRIAQEEIFGPALTMIPFDDEADAVRIANDVRYGLAAYLWTARRRPRPSRRARSRSRHDLGQFGKRAPSADAVRRREDVGHRPRRRRLFLRILYGDQERRHRLRHPQNSETWRLERDRIRWKHRCFHLIRGIALSF